jgi:hypothetical protein
MNFASLIQSSFFRQRFTFKMRLGRYKAWRLSSLEAGRLESCMAGRPESQKDRDFLICVICVICGLTLSLELSALSFKP